MYHTLLLALLGFCTLSCQPQREEWSATSAPVPTSDGDTLVSLNACTAGEQYMTLEARFVSDKKVRQETFHFDNGSAALFISRTAQGNESGMTLTETRYFMDGTGVYARVSRSKNVDITVSKDVDFTPLSGVEFKSTDGGLSYGDIVRQSEELIVAWESL